MTFTIKTRGAPRPIAAEFRCPVHGVFTAIVDSGTNEARCPEPVELGCGDPECCGYNPQHAGICGEMSPWSPSLVPMRMRRVEATKGRDESAEHPEWNFQRNLEDGQDRDEWEADREAAAEERRKQMVIDAVRSDR